MKPSNPIDTQGEDLTTLMKPQKDSSDDCYYLNGDISGFDLVLGYKSSAPAVLLEDLSK